MTIPEMDVSKEFLALHDACIAYDDWMRGSDDLDDITEQIRKREEDIATKAMEMIFGADYWNSGGIK